MRGFIFSVLWLGLILAVGWITGDRYGTPDALSNLTSPAFEAIESQIGGSGEE